ncbi:hypothetical protein TWF225_008196 [Orbilia oligospora]|nr:hypothetical protein TWF225_008196 [Orbilia oligospora]KAF3246451.1 hypothetical protein TWF128_008913 [Orbilia oligospora]KAF3268911.1 hypothetical protein TWF217_010198 [Orbilia oligospora]
MIYTVIFLATLQAPLAYAWSYNVLREGNAPTPVADFHGMRVLENRLPCTPLIVLGGDGEVDPVNGLQVYQFAPQPIDRQWARPVKYIGFWGDQKCSGMPRYVVHWYDLVDTAQSVFFDNVIESSLGWGEGLRPILGVHSWAELGDADRFWPGLIPPGSVAVELDDSETEDLEDSYLVLENAVVMVELISGNRRTMPRKDIKWDVYGTGTMNRPGIVQLQSGSDLESTRGNNRLGQDAQEPVDRPPVIPPKQSGNQPLGFDDDDRGDIQIIDKDQFRKNTGRRAKKVPPPLENQAQMNEPVEGEGMNQVDAPPIEARRRKKADTTKKQNSDNEIEAQQQAPNEAQGETQQQSNPSASKETNTPDLEIHGQKMIELLNYWVSLGYPYTQEFLVEQIRKLPDPVYVQLFKLAVSGQITVQQIARYLIDLHQTDLLEAQMLQRAQIQAFNQLELNRLAQSQAQASQLEMIRQAAQRQGLTQSGPNWFNTYPVKPYAGTGMSGNINGNMGGYANSNMNMGGLNPAFNSQGGQQQLASWNFQQMFGNPNNQQQSYGNQAQMYGNQGQMYGNQGQTYGNQGQAYRHQGQAYGNQGGQQHLFGNMAWGGQQGNNQAYQTQQNQQINSQIEQEDYSGTSLQSDEELLNPDLSTLRGNHMPSDGKSGSLGAPPGTPINPTAADYTVGSQDSLEYLRMPHLIAQLPGFAGAGEQGGLLEINESQLGGLADLLRPEARGPPISNTQSTRPTGGSTLSQMLAGMNAGTNQRRRTGAMEEEEFKEEEDGANSEFVKEEYEEF